MPSALGGRTVRATKKSDNKRRAKAKRDTGLSAAAYSSFDPTIPAADLVDLMNTRKGVFKLTQVAPNPALADDPSLWEAFDPGAKRLYTGHRGTSMSRGHWRDMSGATAFANKVKVLQIDHALQRVRTDACARSCTSAPSKASGMPLPSPPSRRPTGASSSTTCPPCGCPIGTNCGATTVAGT